MQQIQQLIEQFWAGDASEEEKKLLYEKFIEHQDEWEAFLSKQYYENLQEKTSIPNEDKSKEILKKLHFKIGKLPEINKHKTIYFGKWLQVAAAAILIISLGLGIYERTNTSPSKSSTSTGIVQNKNVIIRQLIIKQNEGNAIMSFTLTDGSIVKLQPKSSFSYYQPFDSLDRNISLSGKAFFKVAKHKKNTFAVTAAGFNTTAIGTKFSVNTNRDNKISIKLFEGKVVVQSNEQSGLKIKDTYLRAGQELSIDIKKKQQTVQLFNNKIDELNVSKTIKNKTETISALSFNKEPLEAVFVKLKNQYKTQVDFNNADVKGLSFTGSFSYSDSLTSVLSVICNMNDLSLDQAHGRITITKQK